VVERYSRPALVVSTESGEAHGSGRSIPGFHLLEALESCPQLFDRFGGHAAAVGFALPAARLPELRSALDAFARARLTEEDFSPALAIDAELSLDTVTPQLHAALQRLAPFGAANPEPVFAARGVRLAQPPRLLKEIHVKLRVAAPPPGRPLDAMGWRMAERLAPLALAAGDLLDIAFTLEENTHPDFGGLQLVLRDVVKSGNQDAASAGAV
ncbi:MAG: DHHA1 domain-containing protein, partial [Terriglobales bacterium]